MPSPRPLLRRVIRMLIALPILLYGAAGCLLYTQQNSMLFPRQYTNLRPNTRPPAGVEAIIVTGPDGEKVEGWFAPGRGCTPAAPGPAVIYCHGNAELIDDNTDYIRAYTTRGVSILLIEYPGYGRSTGTPSQGSITDAGVKFYDSLAARPEVDPARIVLHGKSLGGGVAAQLLAKRPAAAVILESTFTSVASFAGDYYMPQFLVRHPFRTDDVLKRSKAPVLLFHGRDDEIIPVAHGRALAALRPDAIYVETDGHHNDYPPDPRAYWSEIEKFLDRHSLRASR